MKNGNNGQPEEIEELLHAIQNGSSGAFVKLSELYAPLLNKEVSRYADSLGDADLEDLRQGASISLYRAALAYRADRGVTFGLFAKICVVNGVADTLRYIEKRTADISVETLTEAEMPESDENPQSVTIDKIRAGELWSRIRFTLTALEYQIFDLYLDGYSYAEIARRIGKTPKSVDNALRRVKGKLQRVFDSSDMPE